MEIILGIGGNQGDRLANLESARDKISGKIGEITADSPVIESEPWGFDSENWFLNQVIAVDTSLSPGEVLDECMEIEASMGRKRSTVYSDRPIDIDILFCDDRVIVKEGLTVPHPRLHDRLFVLRPLVKIRPELKHPVFGKNAGKMLADCKDTTETRWYSKQ